LSFASLQHIRDSGVHCLRAYLTRLRSALRVLVDPLDGFLPPSPRRPYFMPTALLGFCPAEFSPSRRCREHFCPPTNPRAVQLGVTPADESTGRTDKPRLPGFDPSESPSSLALGLAIRATGYSLGFWSFPGPSTDCLADTSASAPLTRFSRLR